MNKKHTVPSRYDLTGQTFSRLTVIKHYGKNNRNENLWECECICGNKTVALSSPLKLGKIRSCGCLQKEKATKNLMSITMTHGLSRDANGKKTRLFQIWTGIKTRCFNPNVQEYPNYGGRGISMCKEWLNDYKAFHDWAIRNGYQENLEIDRINNDGDYDPSNCRWATAKRQSNNRRNNKLITYKGATKTISEWARFCGINYATFWNRLKRGWSIEKAMSIPPLTQGGKIKIDGRSKETEKRVKELIESDPDNTLRVVVEE